MDKPDIVRRTEEAVDRHTEPARGARKYARGASREDLRREQQDEAAEFWAGPGVPAMTDAQAKGLVFGMVAGGLLGAVLFLPLALIPFTDAVLARVVLVALVGALAGGTAGALYYGGREPELEGETMDVNGRPSVGTTPRDSHTDRRGR